MGNIFSYCLNIKRKGKNSTLFDRLNDEDEHNKYSYASFIDNENESEQKIIIDNINLIHRKIEILENTTQESLRNIHNDIKHIYEEQETLKKSMYTQTDSINSESAVSDDSIQNPLKGNNSIPNESFINESVQESVYHDIQNKIPNSDEETY